MTIPKPTEKTIENAITILKNTRVSDGYNCGTEFSSHFTNFTILGGHGFIPIYPVCDLIREVLKSEDPTKTYNHLVKNEAQDCELGWFAKSLAHEFDINPLSQGYLLGIEQGVTAVYDGNLITWPNNNKARREYSQDNVDIAIMDGAVFGNKSHSIDESVKILNEIMLTGVGKTITFREAAINMFQDAYKNQTAPKDVLKIPRYQMFEKRLFKLAKEYNY